MIKRKTASNSIQNYTDSEGERVKNAWSEHDLSFFSVSSGRFPGFSKSGPELYLLCKQVPKGKEKLPIYVSHLLTKYTLLHYNTDKLKYHEHVYRQTQRLLLIK